MLSNVITNHNVISHIVLLEIQNISRTSPKISVITSDPSRSDCYLNALFKIKSVPVSQRYIYE